MILVDDQAGSVKLFPYIAKITRDAILTRIDPPYGDIVWCAEGQDGATVNVGVEYKVLNDAMDCMVSGRFSGHQLIGLINNFQRIHLLIEMGRTRIDRDTGVLQRFEDDGRWHVIMRNGRGFTSRELWHWTQTLEEQAGIRVNFTYDKWESARWVINRHSWWVNKGWDEHTSLKQFHVEQPPAALMRQLPFAMLEKPPLRCRVAKELGDVGWERAFAAAKRFGSTREMINANEQTWQMVEGVGRTIAQRIVKEVTSG